MKQAAFIVLGLVSYQRELRASAAQPFIPVKNRASKEQFLICYYQHWYPAIGELISSLIDGPDERRLHLHICRFNYSLEITRQPAPYKGSFSFSGGSREHCTWG
jgi:hypothetical protein